MRHMTKTNAYLAVADRETFTTGGALSGTTNPSRGQTGRLSAAMTERYEADFERGCMDFVVLSYGTPIAWHLTNDPEHGTAWMIPNTRYSATTSAHQGIARRGAAQWGARVYDVLD